MVNPEEIQIDAKSAKSILPNRIADSNKGTFGNILNIAGSRFYQGAAILSSLSALKIGAGYVTLACPDCILNNIAAQTLDITYFPLFSSNEESINENNVDLVSEKTKYYKVMSIGCGLSTASSTVKFVKRLLSNTDAQTNTVIDADAINAIAIENIVELPYNTIITPHPKELSRLINTDIKEIQENRSFYAFSTAKKYGCIVVLKGHNTIVTDGKTVFINKTGNSGLAKAGSGDVLTGMISGLLAQGASLIDAAKLGVYLHGLAADIAVKELTEYSILASDLIKYIPKAIKTLIDN